MQLPTEKVMAGRGFRVTIHLDIHAITCPGVWLCPHGKVTLRIRSLGRTVESRRVPPIFPLLLHERLTFEKVLVGSLSLTMLEKSLDEEQLYAELVQCLGPHHREGIVLASFQRNLTDLLYPVPSYKGLLPGLNIDLLMEPTTHFPGIIVPKIEISTNTMIEDVSAIFKENAHDYIIKPKMIVPKVPNPKRDEALGKRAIANGIIRQKRVCHTKEASNLKELTERRECTSAPNKECCRTLGLGCPTCSQYNYYFESRPRKMQSDVPPRNLSRSSRAMGKPKYLGSQYFPCNCATQTTYINTCSVID